MSHAAKVQRSAQQLEPAPAAAQTPEPESATRRGAGATSADLRTMDYDEGAACLAPKDDAPPAEAAGPAKPGACTMMDPAVEDTFDLIDAALVNLREARSEAAGHLAIDGAKQDAAPWWHEAAIIAGSVALASATMGIGGALFAGAAAASQASGLSTAVASAVVDGLKGAAKSFMGKAIREAMPRAVPPGSDAAQEFFRAQQNVIRESASGEQNTFTEHIRPMIRSGPKPLDQAKAIRRGVASVPRDQVRVIQRQASIDAWCRLQAQSKLNRQSGDAGGPTDMHQALEQRGEAPGLVRLSVVLDAAGQTAKIESARVGGLNERLRGELIGRTVGSLDVPVLISARIPAKPRPPRGRPVHASTDSPGVTMSSADIARDEAGNVLVAAARGPAALWLASLGGADAPAADSGILVDQKAVVLGSSRLVHEVIEPQALSAEVMR